MKTKNLINSVLFLSILLIQSCGGTGNKQEEESNNEINEIENVKEDDEELEKKPSGLALIESSDCSACHMNNEKLVGPSYKQIAERYSENYEDEKSNLISSVIKGGNGKWGEVPMTPHPQHTEEEVMLMVDFIMESNK